MQVEKNIKNVSIHPINKKDSDQLLSRCLCYVFGLGFTSQPLS